MIKLKGLGESGFKPLTKINKLFFLGEFWPQNFSDRCFSVSNFFKQINFSKKFFPVGEFFAQKKSSRCNLHKNFFAQVKSYGQKNREHKFSVKIFSSTYFFRENFFKLIFFHKKNFRLGRSLKRLLEATFVACTQHLFVRGNVCCLWATFTPT